MPPDHWRRKDFEARAAKRDQEWAEGEIIGAGSDEDAYVRRRLEEEYKGKDGRWAVPDNSEHEVTEE